MGLNLQNLSEYSDRLSFTLLSGARKFPRVKPFGDDHQANLTVAFQSLFDGLSIVERHLRDDVKLAQVKELLEKSLKAYRDGDKVTGGRLLNDILDIVAPNRYKEYEQRKEVPG
ncbi:MAG: hypothetical protein ACTHJZ_14040 [Trinickia sp.]|uniref:hypothetical protein n=1 Tax=Trinickia sp. TaxID=2571163 RepID=UPI003F7DF38D